MAAVIMATAVTVQAQRRTPPGPDDTPVFRADVVIDEQVVDEQGAVLETRPQTRYRMTVRRSGRRLRTEIVYPPARLLTTGPLVDPRGGYRLVFDGDMANGRIYDATGALVFGPADEAAPAADAGGAAAPGLVVEDRDLMTRKRDLVQRFGPALERVTGRDRYLASEGNRLTETLVEPTTNLPVEVNILSDGALEQRTALAYARMPGGRWYVARTRSEVALPGDHGRRFVSTRTHTNVAAQEVR